jgi:hypothetical protein
MIEDLRTAIGEVGIGGCALTIALGVILLPFYLGCYLWQLAMNGVMIAFNEMLENESERDARDRDQPPHRLAPAPRA